jgi:hypothetical protein
MGDFIGSPIPDPCRLDRQGVFAEDLGRGLSLREVEQAPKGIWWMPRHQEAMKDVARCEKPWGGASNR